MADADQLERVIEHAEHGIASEVHRADIVLDHVIGHRLAEAQQAIFLAERKKMGEQLLAVAGSQFPNENWRGTGDADRLGRAKVRLVHRGFLKKTIQRLCIAAQF